MTHDSRMFKYPHKMYEYHLALNVPFQTQKWNLTGQKTTKISRSLTLKAKVSLGIAVVMVTLGITVLVVCLILPSTTRPDDEVKDYWLPDYTSNSTLGNFSSAAVTTDAAPCAAIGKDILLRNGSAMDATIAVLLCMGAVNPQSSGLGGGAFMLVYNRSAGDVSFIDAREVAPAKANANMFDGNKTLSAEGGLSIAVPGELAGLVYAHKKYGVLPWRELFEPTINLCRTGIRVTAHLAKALKGYGERIKKYEPISNVFVNNETGEVFKEGDVLKRLDLADTLEVVAEEGLEAMYGPSKMADDILTDLQAVGSIIDRDDMMSYAPKIRQPIQIPLRNNMTLYSVSTPGSGALLAFILGVLDGYKDMDDKITKTEEETVLALHRTLESFKFAFAKRTLMQDDDSLEVDELVQNLTSRSYADEIRKQIDDTKTYNDPHHYGAGVSFTEDHGTASMTVVAPNGDTVVVTSTVNLYFGSLMMSPSTGVLFNNEMDDFSSPNITNYFGIPPTNKNHAIPGRRPMSSMAPAIVVDSQGDVVLATSGNGGTQITTSVAQIIMRNLWFGDDIKRTIDGPRLHHQLFPNYIECEELYPQSILDKLEMFGHKVQRLQGKMVGIGVGVARKDGRLYANSDYRKQGEVDGF